jgi:hypothetical protein
MKISLKGPNKFVKKTGEIRALKSTDIETATFKWKGKTYNLLENHFLLTLGNDNKEILIYHMYDYLNEKGIKEGGRWYKWFKTISFKDNTFTHKMEAYEDESDNYSVSPATISVTFKNKVVEKIQNLFNKLI